MSKTALDRLGERLVRHGQIPEDDIETFTAVADAYQDALEQVAQCLAELGYAASTRIKTTGVLIEKLRRESCRLSQVQDLAGARIVLSDRRRQDEAVNRIKKTFDRICAKPCKVRDRRVDPSHGYRAVHVIVFLDGIPVEIQVRTELQDVWAQILERLGDRWGRGIRYGERPENPEALVRIGDQGLSRSQVLEALRDLGDVIDLLEKLYLDLEEHRAFTEEIGGVRQALRQSLTEAIRQGLTADALQVPEDTWEAALAIYRRTMEWEGREVVPPSSARTVGDLQILIDDVHEISEARLQALRARADELEAETRRILGMFSQAAEEVITDP